MEGTESQYVSSFFNGLLELIEKIEKVPRWRKFIALFFLGNDVCKQIIKSSPKENKNV